jgi:hypothetical protein
LSSSTRLRCGSFPETEVALTSAGISDDTTDCRPIIPYRLASENSAIGRIRPESFDSDGTSAFAAGGEGCDREQEGGGHLLTPVVFLIGVLERGSTAGDRVSV